MGILRPIARDDIVEDDVRSFVDIELGPFDKVRETGLEKGQGGPIVAASTLMMFNDLPPKQDNPILFKDY